MLVIPMLGRLRQEDHEFDTGLHIKTVSKNPPKNPKTK
jgi:hypothetical protein